MSYKIALLIDAENISYKDYPRIPEVLARYNGRVVLRAVYADWQKSNLQNWHGIAKKNGFKIRHQTNNPYTKNSADMKLIMDAMDVLYCLPRIQVFFLVSNDADYVPLCDKIHEHGKYVVGIGHKNAADAFIRSCDQFVFIKPVTSNEPEAPSPPSISTQPKKVITPLPISNLINSLNGQSPPAAANVLYRDELEQLLIKAFTKSAGDEGWVALSTLGSTLSEIKDGFRANYYGHATLSKVLHNMPDFIEIQVVGSITYARPKQIIIPKRKKPLELKDILNEAFSLAPKDGNRWVSLSALGSAISEVHEGFRPNHYGHATLSKLLQNMPDFVELKTNGRGKSARLKSNTGYHSL